MEILKGAVSSDHIHILASLDPSTLVSTLVKYLKGKTSKILQMQYPNLRKKYWGQHLWARGYFAVSVGNVTAEMIKQYIVHHLEESSQGDDVFRIEK